MNRYHFEIDPSPFVHYLGIADKSPGHKVTTQPSFGLLDFSYGDENPSSKKPWERFVNHVKKLNSESPSNVAYKIVFLTRHGLGLHNVQEAKVGVEAWNLQNHWSLLDGDGTVTWADAHLVPAGIEQAKTLGALWESAVTTECVPLPQTLYCSPLARCLETCKLEFTPVFSALLDAPSFKPKVRELLRERLWDHTCDRRSKRGWIEANYPGYEIEESLTEEDELWRQDSIESLEDHAARKQKAMGEIWEADANDVISLTIHSGAISAVLRVCGVQDFHVAEGSCIAVLIKGTKHELPN
ncbi:histidine phosphatase superfamily [Zalerion maritima]|uniref:Histidine phosphatase superfamily n=1 Tax=Zalerion maritima TaxID=339359 RepID=A0AAD5WRJ1_9PEZI|nr:histidine phosphatase superfamily [Zalerion maritima]